MPTRLERLERRLAEAAAAVRGSSKRLREARAERLTRALAAPTLAERLAALDDPILTRADRRRLREHVGVSLAPESRTGQVRERRGLAHRLEVAVARWRPNPFHLLSFALIGGSIVTALGFAWAHTGRGARLSGLCPDLVFTWPDGKERHPSLFKGTRVSIRRESAGAVTIASWGPLTGYGTATVEKACLDTDK